MASGDVIVRVADKETTDKILANTNALLASLEDETRVKDIKRYGLKINKNDSNLQIFFIILHPFINENLLFILLIHRREVRTNNRC